MTIQEMEKAHGDAAVKSGEFAGCPVCPEGTGNPEGGDLKVQDGSVWQEVSCADCGSTWQEVYRPAFTDSLKVGAEVPHA